MIIKHTGLEPVNEAHVIMARHVAHHLCRLRCPRLLRVVHLRHVHLRVLYAACNTKLQALLHIGCPAEYARLGVVVEGTAQCVAYLVAEGGNARHLRNVCLLAELLAGQSAAAGTPSLAIDEYRRIYLVDHLAYLVHRLNVVTAHQVEAEAVDVVLVDPVFHALQHEAPHHGLLRSRLVATTRTVAVVVLAVLSLYLPIVIVGIGALEVAVVYVIRMVVHHVKDDADACLVECLHHLLELADAHLGTIGVSRVAALRHVVVDGVVAPVVLRRVKTRLVYRTVVVGRQYVDSRHAELLQVSDGPRLGQRQELAWIAGFTAGYGEVAVVQLVDDLIDRRLAHRAAVTLPPCRIGSLHVDNSTAATVHAYCLGKHARCLAAPHVERIETPHEVALYLGRPDAVLVQRHPDRLQCLASLALLVDAHLDALGVLRCKEPQHGRFFAVVYFVEVKVL